MIQIQGLLKIVARQGANAFLLVKPWRGTDIVIEFSQHGEMKVPEVTLGEEVDGNFEWLGGRETIDAGFFIRGFANEAVQLAIAIIGCVDGLEGNELRRVRRKIGSMFFITPRMLVDALNLIRCAG